MTKANATTTLAQVCKAIVTDAIDHDYLLECDASLKEIYDAECGFGRKAASPKACMDYLQGLPSVCTVPFYNGEILELLTAQGISRKTEDGQCALIEKYWQECGKAFYNLVK